MNYMSSLIAYYIFFSPIIFHLGTLCWEKNIKRYFYRYENTQKDFDANNTLFPYQLGRSLASHLEDGQGL
jgi:hypothetical protein